MAIDWTNIRGFNYQPSFGSTGLELWRNFDAAVFRRELELGRKYFPRINAIRLWLSWDAFNRGEAAFAAKFEQSLAILHELGLSAMVVLFNRWHDSVLDYGGIYDDHFLPKASYWFSGNDLFSAYIKSVVGAHAHDERVLAWDLCNEPFGYSREEAPGGLLDAEFGWLKQVHDLCRRQGTTRPITVGLHAGHGVPGMEQVEPLCDVLSIHPYWWQELPTAPFEKMLDEYADFAAKVRKPLIASETCWGRLDDAKRVEIIRYTLGQLTKRRIGFLAYLLHHSPIADAHRPEHGYVGFPGNLLFIEADGSLRPGHEAFNEF